MVEAMRLAFADARQYVADLATDPAPIDWLLSDAYAAERRALISPDAAMQPPSFGTPPAGSDTVYLSVVDGQGNACSFINSLYTGFGSGIVAQGYGFFLQSRGALFTLEDGHPNVLAPNKRPYHTIIPAMATQRRRTVGVVRRDGRLHAAAGTFPDDGRHDRRRPQSAGGAQPPALVSRKRHGRQRAGARRRHSRSARWRRWRNWGIACARSAARGAACSATGRSSGATPKAACCSAAATRARMDRPPPIKAVRGSLAQNLNQGDTCFRRPMLEASS